MLHSFPVWEFDFVDLHGIQVLERTSKPSWLGLLDLTVPSSSEFPESYHISVELSCFI